MKSVPTRNALWAVVMLAVLVIAPLGALPAGAEEGSVVGGPGERLG